MLGEPGQLGPACAAAGRCTHPACCRGRWRRAARRPATSALRRTASPGRRRQAGEQSELGRRELRRDLPAGDRVGGRVESQAADDDRLVVAGAPQQRADPGHQLGEVERLGQVVVAAGAEAREPIGQGAARGQEEDRRADALGAQRLDDVAAVRVGQADVDDEGVGNGARRPSPAAPRRSRRPRPGSPPRADRARGGSASGCRPRV